MAFLPVLFPDDWPDFVVTSHKRAKGSHATGNAFDIAPVWPSGDYSPTSKFWFYYFHTFFVLWAAQGKGKMFLSVPPTCPHLHLHYKPDVNEIGLEWINKVKDKDTGQSRCVPYYSRKVSKYDLVDSIRFRNFIENYVATGNQKGKYLGAWSNVWKDLENKFDFTKKRVAVTSSFDSLPDSKLQGFLNSMYGDSSATRFLDDMSMIITGNRYEDSKGKLLGNAALIAIFAGVAYFLYKEYGASRAQQSSVSGDRRLSRS